MDLEKFEHAITKYGTPLYVFDIDEVKRKTDYFRDRFRESAGLCFAIKANPFLTCTMSKVTDRIEVCSMGEFEICRELQIEAEKLLISGVLKKKEDITEILNIYGGRCRYTVESVEQLYSYINWSSTHGEKINVSIIGAVAVCCMTLYMLDSTKSAMDIALDLTVFQLGPVQVSSFLFVLVCFFAFYASNKKLTSDWLEQKTINEKLVLDAYARVKAYDGKKSEKRSVLMSLPFFIMAVVGVVLSKEVISVVCGVIGVLVLTASRLVYSMAKKDVEGALYQILPEWMFDMALLLQTNNVQVALAKSIESAETLLKQELMELVERITDDPENIQSYLMFFRDFDVPEIATCMKMLYSISVAGSGNVEKQLTDLVGHVHKMEEKAMEQQGKNIAFKAHMITLYPVGATSAKILVDMMCGTIMFFQIFSAAL